MGRDKAGLVLAGTTETVAVRTARLLCAVAEPVLEVGGSATDLPQVPDRRRLAGPLAALADAGVALAALPWCGPVLVVATDLPRLSAGMLAWLAGHPASGPVVPLDAGGRPQPLCARYPWTALEEAGRLVAAGATRMDDLLARTDPTLCPPAEWAVAAGGTKVLADVDTPDDLLALTGPGSVTGG
jgi:molybdopterin-guanine dinucleotide biosynthesis protein A